MIETSFPKRLIEVDLPIKRISEHARREKSIRHGHISTLHIWWARRPLAACRAVICAALWPDPADDLCSPAFRSAAGDTITAFALKVTSNKSLAQSCSPQSFGRWTALIKPEGHLDPADPAHLNVLRYALLDFIADFANWDNSTVPEYLETARALTQAAHEALGGAPGTRPLVVDPFAGGGAIPLEALRVGADAFASDLNPVAVLLNKVVLEYIPKYGQRLADEVRKWGEWIKEQAEHELAEFYPKDPDGATPIAYLWARTITCEGPGCGAEVPLMRSLWLAKKGSCSVALQLVPDNKRKRVDFEIIEKQGNQWVSRTDPKSTIEAPQFDGTVRRGSATCPVCGYTTPVKSVRSQLKARKGGADDARLFCVVTTRPAEQGRFYRLPNERDLEAVRNAAEELERRKREHKGPLSLVPDEQTPQGGGSGAGRAFSQRNYGMDSYNNFFGHRQSLAMVTFVRLVRNVGKDLGLDCGPELAIAVQTCLAMALDRQADHTNSLCAWNPSGQKLQHLFARAALPIVWDFAEAQPFGDSVGDWWHAIDCVLIALDNASHFSTSGHVEIASATVHPLPDDMAQGFFTDPPYYDAVPYADLSDFFFVWLKRTVGEHYPELFVNKLTPKDDECILDEVKGKDKAYFEHTMMLAMSEGRRVLEPNGIGLVVFANKTTSGWEAQLQAMIDAGWTVTGSWPIDTELATRLRGMDSAALASSIHLVCRPRPDAERQQSEIRDPQSTIENVGDWRDVIAELPRRIHAWLPRLAQEGVVGADAIFACLGPALEIFSRYARVEKASGEVVTLKEYLEHVWAAVSREALTMIFTGADTTDFEEDARLTAMWLWTLSTAGENGGTDGPESEADEAEDEGQEIANRKSQIATGFVLEYDAARKIAQGLGAHLERLTSMVEVKGDKARLLAVSERARYLFGKDEGQAPARRAKKSAQLSLFQALDEAEEESGWGEKSAPEPGETILDRVHQSMILFAAGRSEALKRFLVDDGMGRDQRFWRLAQAFSALYPPGTEEKRWVDGVLARKKGLGF
ncbi:MAG: DUF1156 domain-containing protein [Thermoflexales bacterium]|nr:DUF1156 domain-containing protein [Thermoflexales bacterium]